MLARRFDDAPSSTSTDASSHGDECAMLANPEVAKQQAWNMRVVPPLKQVDGLKPVASCIKLRTEFSGAGTAEESMVATAAMWNCHFATCVDKMTVKPESIGDWCSSARYVCGLNNPEACRFGDIMTLANSKLRAKLLEPLVEKAIQFLLSSTNHKPLAIVVLYRCLCFVSVLLLEGDHHYIGASVCTEAYSQAIHESHPKSG